MLCLVAQIATFVLGIIALVKGEVKLTGSNVVHGPRARVIGVLLLLPLTLALGIGFIVGLVAGARGQADVKELQSTFVIIEVTSFVLPMGVALLLSFLPGGQAPRRRRRDDWDDEFDDYRERRGRRGRRDRDRDEDWEPSPAEADRAGTGPAPVVELVPEEPTTVHCPACKKHLAIPSGNVGKSVRCPACQQVFVAEATPRAARIECTQCRKELQIPESALGKSVRCPGCQAVFVAKARQEAIQARSAPLPLPPAPAAKWPSEREYAPDNRRRPRDDREHDCP